MRAPSVAPTAMPATAVLESWSLSVGVVGVCAGEESGVDVDVVVAVADCNVDDDVDMLSGSVMLK